MLQSSDYLDAISSINDELVVAQMYNWKELIAAANIKAKVADSSSLEKFLKDLALEYGDTSQLVGDATVQFKDFNALLSEAPLRPNDR